MKSNTPMTMDAATRASLEAGRHAMQHRHAQPAQAQATFWQKMFAAWVRPYEKGDVFML